MKGKRGCAHINQADLDNKLKIAERCTKYY